MALAAVVLLASQAAIVDAAVQGQDTVRSAIGSYLHSDGVAVAYAIWIVNAALAILLGLRLQSFFVTSAGLVMSAVAVATLVGWSSVVVALAIVFACTPVLFRAMRRDDAADANLPFSRFDGQRARSARDGNGMLRP
ncbi:hypothetical protein [Jannaschia ovalis]|uniref:Uncharacterized protein n=1 Tax=Jannaschia ovalis TaxID=3038773 RepID=A0ABY8LDB2_9RHOB|nr:hypothetical protein [Jannaschia sp. GRR-S6-38]WGH78285.1 hypothetical protein P8627_14835 [Jannaschia sp. GRR-S6-38]